MRWVKALLTSNSTKPPTEKNNNAVTTKTHYGIVVLWLTFTVMAAIYFISERLVSFDPKQKLTNVTKQALVNSIIAEFHLPDHLPNTVINFVDPNCRCNKISLDHLSDVNKNAVNDDMSVMNVTLPSDFSGLIPSTPAVLVLDNNGELIYFGPYSEGLSCGKGEGIIDLVLSNYKKGFNAQLIMANSEGCYCNT